MAWQELSSTKLTVSVMLRNLHEHMTDNSWPVQQRLGSAYLWEAHAGDLGALGQLPQRAHPGLEQGSPALLVIRGLHAVHELKRLPGAHKISVRQDASATAQATSAQALLKRSAGVDQQALQSPHASPCW